MRTRITPFLVLAWTLLMPALAAAQDGEFVIGLIPEENIFRKIKRYRPLETYLTEKLGMKVKFTILSRYQDIIERFTSRHLDGAFFGIYTALMAHEQLGVVPIARPVNLDGSSAAQGVLFTRKDTGIASAQAMRGRRIAFVDKATATGYLFALSYLREHGIRSGTGYFKEAIFTGSHDATVYTVISGKADLGVAKNLIIERLMKNDPVIRDELKVIAKSADLPDMTLCVRNTVPEKTRRLLSDALVSMDATPEGKKVLARIELLRFVPASAADFDRVTELAEKAGVRQKGGR